MATPHQPKPKSKSDHLNRSLPAKPEVLIRGAMDMSDGAHGGRVHTSSSVPRTRFTSNTPRSEREAMEKIRTKMTFSDHSAESSAESTPRKKQTNMAPEKGASPSYVVDGSRMDDDASEGEVPSSVTVQDIFIKLDSVKNYLKEAGSLRLQLQGKLSEPGASAQVEKLDKLIWELKKQETSYLGVLLRIMDRGETFSQLDTTQEESDSEGSGDEGSLEGNKALSLKAELQQQEDGELTADQEEELRVLRQQQQMLRDLIQQQEKIKELEEKQAELLRRRSVAQKELKEAEARTQEYQRLNEAAALVGEEKPSTSKEPSKEIQDCEQEDELERREALLSKIAALRERKEKLEGLMDSFAQVELEDPEDTPEGSEAGEGSEANVDQAEVVGGNSELVNAVEGHTNSKMAELEAKLRKAAETKLKLTELRLTIDSLKEATGMNEDDRTGQSTPSDQESDEKEEGAAIVDTTLEEEDELERSLVMEYQQRLARKRQEVAHLQKQKENLLEMQEKILTMQEQYLGPIEDDEPGPSESPPVGEEGFPQHLAQELEKQKELYDEIMAKTKRLKNLRVQYQEEMAKTSEHDTYSLTSSTRLLTDADLTAATWGGSTVQSDESENTDSSQEDQQQATGARSASVQADNVLSEEQVQFSVTRHTPRRRPPTRRTLSDMEDSPKIADKRRKLDGDEQNRGATSMAKNRSTRSKYGGPGKLSAVWPSVILPNLRKKTASTRDSSTQTPTHSSTAGAHTHAANFPPRGPGAANFSARGLQEPMMPPRDPQFVFMSNMCSELLRGQNTLIGAVCQKMDLDANMSKLLSYHRELDAYYREMQQAHATLGQSQDHPQSEAEDPINTQPPPESATEQADNARYSQPQPGIADPLSSGGSRYSNNFLRPPPSLWGPSPLSYQPGWYSNPSPFSFSPYMFGGSGASPFSFNAWSTGYSPQAYSQNPFNSGASNEEAGFQSQAHTRDFTLNSPSGVTSLSVQVQAPSSPPMHSPHTQSPPTHSPPSLNVNNNNTAMNQAPASSTVTQSSSAFGVSVSSVVPTSKSLSKMANSSVGARGKEQDEESMSSLPVSVPDVHVLAQSSSEVLLDGESGFSLFDALRDTIYSEVATLIANNESRPHYLVELFRELQLVNSDYLRQRALYNIQDLVTRFLTGDDEITPTHRVADSEEDEVTTEEGGASKHHHSNSQTYDYVESVPSASSLITPPGPDPPFMGDHLGDTVIRRNMTLTIGQEDGEDDSPPLQAPVESSGPPATEGIQLDTSYELEPDHNGSVLLDTQLLDEQIKNIMTEVIPVLKANIAASCSPPLLEQIRKTVLDLVLKQEKKRSPEFIEMLTKQLNTTVTVALQKYNNKQFKECGEDMLVDLSEVLFNELSFFSLMEDLRDHPQLNSDFRSVTSSATTTENEDTGDEGRTGGAMDALLLQALALHARRSLVNEEEALGKVRDDELVRSWDPNDESDEEKSDIAKEEIASNATSGRVTETPEPLVEVSAEETPSDPQTSTAPQPNVEGVANDDNTETTGGEDLPVPVWTDKGPGEETCEDNSEIPKLDGSADIASTERVVAENESPSPVVESTPPVIAENESPSPVVESTPPVIAENESPSPVVESTPLVSAENESPSPVVEPIPPAALDVQLKSEQEAVEGLPAILATIEGQGELAGTGEELPPNNLAEP